MGMPGNSEKVTNLEAANRQLVTAIKLFFANGDPIAVHTLACAAREIYEKHCKAADITRTFDYVKDSNAHLSEKQLWNILNGPRNFFKHPADHLNDSIEFSDEYNDFMILSAVHDHGMLKGQDQSLEMQTYAFVRFSDVAISSGAHLPCRSLSSRKAMCSFRGNS